jgi:hypothetical protein
LQYGVLAPAGVGFDEEVGMIGVVGEVGEVGVIGVVGFDAEPAAPVCTGDAFGAVGVVLAAEPATAVVLGELTPRSCSAEPSSEPHATAYNEANPKTNATLDLAHGVGNPRCIIPILVALNGANLATGVEPNKPTGRH